MPMQSRTDQVHSYEFFLQRVISGLVARESDPAELPFRRLGWAGFGSVMVAIVVAAIFGIIGMLVGGGATGWRDGKSIVVEKGDETPYIFREGRLHPMLNFVSAQLALGGDPEVARVSADSLAGVPRGATLGIQGAPAGLPGNGDLLTGDWSLCSEQRPDGSGGTETVSVVGVGRGPAGGEPVGERAVVVTNIEDGADYLVWRGHRYAIDAPGATLSALGFGGRDPQPVSAAWLDALAAGDPLRPPQIGDRGQPTTALGEQAGEQPVLTGQIIEDNDRFFLVDAAQLREMTELQADVVLRDTDTRQAYPDGPIEVRNIPVNEGVKIAVLPDRTESSPPLSRPDLVPEDSVDAALCARFPADAFAPQVWAGGRLSTDGAIETPGVTARGTRLADYVLVEGGKAALVLSVTSPDAGGGTWHVVTHQGISYPLPGPELADSLGYERDQQVRVPGGLLKLLPEGPALDPAAADRPVQPGDPGGAAG